MTLAGCMPKTIYPIYKTEYSQTMFQKDNMIVYEDDNCTVTYNLWSEYGNAGFVFFNKSEENIYVNLHESFFIRNGIAYDYFRGRAFSEASRSHTTVSRAYTPMAYTGDNATVAGITAIANIATAVSGNAVAASSSESKSESVTFQEQETICIPPNAAKIVYEYNVQETLFKDCELPNTPTKNQIITKNYSMQDAPIMFSNIISYTVGHAQENIIIKNDFYVSQIANYPESEVTEVITVDECGKPLYGSKRYFKDVTPDKFYIKYEEFQN
jgi:hypothetical protein